jgi:hypothetical protein
MLARAIPNRMLPYVVTIVRAGTTTDRYGNEVRDWNNATRTDTPAWIEQQRASEDDDDRAQLTSSWLLVVPATVQLAGLDRIEYNGETFEVVGPPNVVRTPTGPHHIEAVLSWVTG